MKRFLFALLVALCLASPSRADQTNLAHAIAYAEGFNVRGSKAQRNHNPGNIRDKKGKYVRYKSDAEGWAALKQQLLCVATGRSKRYDVNMTLRQFGRVYADGSKYWAKNVAKLLGVPVTAKMWEVLDVAPYVPVACKLKELTI